MRENIVRCPMCQNHCDVRMLRCIRGRQWQMRQRARMAKQNVSQPAAKPEKTDVQNTKKSLIGRILLKIDYFLLELCCCKVQILII